MKSLYRQLSQKIINSKGYNSARNDLFEAYILKSTQNPYNISKISVNKLSTTLQYFYRSEHDEYVNEGAILLSMLLHVSGESNDALIAIAENVFSHAGDFPNVQLLKSKFKNINLRISFYDNVRKDLRKSLNTVTEIDHPLTDYQRTLWEDLTSGYDVITSAPTSTGKTHIILRYMMERLIQSEGAFAVVIVPTRALIAELSGKIYEIAKNKTIDNSIEVCTVPKEGRYMNKTFFVMTQERLFEVIQRGDINFDYLFIDEAHNISDKSRGVLLHLTLQKLLEGSNPQIVISMPSPRYQNAFDSVFEGVRFTKKATKHSPVAKVLMPVTLKGRKINISQRNCGKVVSIDKNFKGSSFANLIYQLGQGEINIVYRNRTDYCENVAKDIAELVKRNKDCSMLEEAADYVETFLHKDFSLANCLRKGVAFHYGPLPGAIRTMIETLAKNGDIDFIVCTSTLAEGVNLPAKNLFLKNPAQQNFLQPATKLEDVTFDNITGRAGRMLEHFSGNVFIVDHDDWAFQDYFEERKEEADMIPTYFQLLNEDLDRVIEALKGKYDNNSSDHYSLYTIANKLLKEYDSEILTKTMHAKELTLNDKEKKRLEANIKHAYDGLKVDTFTLEANPTIGFIQQNSLYNHLSEQADLSTWVLPHPKSSTLYSTLKTVCHALFDAGIFIPNEGITVDFVCVIAKKWMTGESLKTIITEQIDYDNSAGKDYNCNRSVRTVIKVINNDVRFRMSSALRCYHSLITSVIGTRTQDLQSIKIHSFIEVGGCDDRFINLVNFGFSRETSLEVDRIVPKHVPIETLGDLEKLLIQNKLDRLHVVNLREINNLLS